MRRWLLAIVVVTLAAAQGCAAEVREPADQGGDDGGAAAGGELRLAVVPKAVGFDFWEQVRLGAECAASTAENVSMQWDGVTAETDVTGQVNLLQNFITQGVDGLVYAATDARVLSEVTTQAQDAGVTVINIDSGTDPQPGDVPVYATDNVASAEKAADLLAEAVGEGPQKIALVSFQPGTATNDQRVTGFKTGLEQHPNLELVAEQSSQSDYNTALRVTEDILTANPDLNGIFAANEPSVLGAAEAVRLAGREGDVKIIGWDASPDELEGVRQGVISALVVQNPFRMGFDGVNAAVAALRGGEAPTTTDTGVTFVTPENIDSPEATKVLEPSCDDPPQ